MAQKLYFPDARGRSATAVQGKSDLRDENIFSALVFAQGGTGQQLVFTNPRGQSIPSLKGSTITPVQPQNLTYTELTTNLTKAGELGASIGDAAIRSIGATITPAPLNNNATASGYALYGAQPADAAEILNKTFFRLEIAGKKQIEGATWMFPGLGALYGTMTTTSSATTAGVVSNGLPGKGRQLRIPIMIARSDTLNGVVGIAGAATLAFSTATGAGQETLVWYHLLAAVRGDVR